MQEASCAHLAQAGASPRVLRTEGRAAGGTARRPARMRQFFVFSSVMPSLTLTPAKAAMPAVSKP